MPFCWPRLLIEMICHSISAHLSGKELDFHGILDTVRSNQRLMYHSEGEQYQVALKRACRAQDIKIKALVNVCDKNASPFL